MPKKQQHPQKQERISTTPKTIKQRILFILRDELALVGLSTIKNRLQNEFGMTKSPTFNTLVNKALKELHETEKQYFGKIRSSYHGGEQSIAYKDYLRRPATCLFGAIGSTTEGQPKRDKKPTPPTTMKERILDILSHETKLVGLPTIKKRLQTTFGMSPSAAFNNSVKKALKEMLESGDENFGKIGGSYHGGERSAAYIAHHSDQTDKEVDAEHHEFGHTHCCYCNKWGDNEFIDEDAVARGGLHKCVHCKKTFWTWISDGYVYGHEIEYRFGDGKEDYEHFNKHGEYE